MKPPPEEERELMETKLEGVVRAHRYDPTAKGKQFLGAAVEGEDGTIWVIDYEEQSPFHAFDGHHVVAYGEPYDPGPESQHLVEWGEGKDPRHFRVATMRHAGAMVAAELVEIGPGHRISGHLGREVTDPRESTLSFVSEKGDSFLVANDPAGAILGRNVEVWAYPVQMSPTAKRLLGQYLWIICPYSAAELWEWRKRRS
jgi:hypothetical protein